jgi:hypothetical protein
MNLFIYCIVMKVHGQQSWIERCRVQITSSLAPQTGSSDLLLSAPHSLRDLRRRAIPKNAITPAQTGVVFTVFCILQECNTQITTRWQTESDGPFLPIR